MTRDGRIWAAFAVLLLLSSVPIFSTVLPPLFDYPNHLARMHLLAEGGNPYYATRWAPLPNLAEDLVVPLLAQVLPLDLAGKLFLVATFALIAGGTLLINRQVTGRALVWPLTAFLLLYSRVLLWGFLNYLFGLGLALVALALWLRQENEPAWRRLAVAVPLALACYIAHVEAFALLAIMLAGVELAPSYVELRAGDWLALRRRSAIAVAPLAIPAALFFELWQPHAEGGMNYAAFSRKADLLFSVFDNYNRPFDIACFAVALVTLLTLAAWRRLGLAPRMRGAVWLLFVAYLALPSQLFSGSGADHRVPLAMFLLLIAGSAPSPGSRTGRVLAVAAALLFVVRLGAIEHVWLRSDSVYRADLDAIDALPPGVKLAAAYPARAINVVKVPEVHLPTLAIARRDGFVPTLFTYASQQPIAVRADVADLADKLQPADLWHAFAEADAPQRRALLPLLTRMDYIVFTGVPDMRLPADPCLAPVFNGPSFKIFRIEGCSDAGP